MGRRANVNLKKYKLWWQIKKEISSVSKEY